MKNHKAKLIVIIVSILMLLVATILVVLNISKINQYEVAFCDVRVADSGEPYLLVSYYTDNGRNTLTKSLSNLTEFERFYLYANKNDYSIGTARVYLETQSNVLGIKTFCLKGD